MTYKTNTTPEETGLKVGEKYTLLKVSEFMANTVKIEITITGFKQVEQYAQYNNLLMIIFKQRGKRKEQGFYLKKSDVYLRGWDLGIVIDSDTEKGFKGNALINLVADNPEGLIKIFENNYICGERGIIFYTSEEDILKDDGKPLFMEEAKNQIGEHAVITRALQC